MHKDGISYGINKLCINISNTCMNEIILKKLYIGENTLKYYQMHISKAEIRLWFIEGFQNGVSLWE